MKNLLVIILLLCFLTSCVTQERCNEKFPPQTVIQKEDSIRTIETTRDSISYYTDSSYVKAYLACDEHGRVIMQELLAYKSGKTLNIPLVTVKDNVLTAICDVDSMAVYNLIKSKVSTGIKNTVTQKIVTVNILTPFQKFRCTAFWWESLILLIILFIFIKNIFYGKNK